jgi:hypothetical protein
VPQPQQSQILLPSQIKIKRTKLAISADLRKSKSNRETTITTTIQVAALTLEIKGPYPGLRNIGIRITQAALWEGKAIFKSIQLIIPCQLTKEAIPSKSVFRQARANKNLDNKKGLLQMSLAEFMR